MSRVLNIGLSGQGKSTISKNILTQYASKYKKNGTYFILTNYPKDWLDFKLKGTTIILPQEDLDDLVFVLFNCFNNNEEWLQSPKTLYVDDASAGMNNLDKMWSKLLTEARHINLNIILNVHNLKTVHIQNIQHFSDFIIFSGAMPKKIEEVYKDFFSGYFDYSPKEFLQYYKDKVNTNGFHSYIYIKLPTLQNEKAKMLINNFNTDNSL